MRLNFFSQSTWKSIRQGIGHTIQKGPISAAIAGSSLLWGTVVRSQVNLSPLLIDTPAKAGQARGVIDIRNTSDREFRARMYAEPFTYDRNNGFKTLTASPTDLRPYLQFSPQEVNIPPGGLRRVRITVKLPQNIPDGEYRAIIFTEPLTDLSTTATTNKTSIVTRIGTAFYVHQGNLKPNLRIDSVTWNQAAKKLQLLVGNSGKASIQSAVTWSISQGGKVVQTGENPPATIIAEEDRYLLMQNGQAQVEPLASGNYQVSGTLTSGRETKQVQNFNFNVTVPPTVKKKP
jgi:hypothetical protein